jgi:hypothetical protein
VETNQKTPKTTILFLVLNNPTGLQAAMRLWHAPLTPFTLLVLLLLHFLGGAGEAVARDRGRVLVLFDNGRDGRGGGGLLGSEVSVGMR